MDIRTLLPVHPAYRHFLGMKWSKNIYADTCLPFGLAKLLNVLAGLLPWLAQQSGVSFLVHYLNDFLTIDPPNSAACGNNLNILEHLCEDLGIALALEKVEGPLTTICFLGIKLDTICFEIIEFPLTNCKELKTLY